jgi:hypothetical protein
MLLHTRRRRAPEVWEPMIVMTIGPQHHELFLDEERR